LLPTLSFLSVRNGPETRLRHRCSSRYLRISPLHREFQSPLPSSSKAVSDAVPRLSRGISHQTYPTACEPFTPNESEQRSPSLYYRGCWHRVSHGFLCRYYQISRLFTVRRCSQLTGVYNPKTFIPHAASLRQACAHCEKFETAATRRCRDRVSVPVWLIVLSDQLPVSLGGPLPRQLADRPRAHLIAPGLAVPGFSPESIALVTTCGIS
jgi:hypothetical protein